MWLYSIILICLHLIFNYLAVRCVSLKTLNSQRSRILLDEFVSSNQVLSPQKISEKESILSPLFFNDGIVIGASISRYPLDIIHEIINTKKSVVIVQTKVHKNMTLFIEKGASEKEILEGYLTALIMTKKKISELEAQNYFKETSFFNRLFEAGWDSGNTASLFMNLYEFSRQ